MQPQPFMHRTQFCRLFVCFVLFARLHTSSEYEFPYVNWASNMSLPTLPVAAQTAGLFVLLFVLCALGRVLCSLPARSRRTQTNGNKTCACVVCSFVPEFSLLVVADKVCFALTGVNALLTWTERMCAPTAETTTATTSTTSAQPSTTSTTTETTTTTTPLLWRTTTAATTTSTSTATTTTKTETTMPRETTATSTSTTTEEASGESEHKKCYFFFFFFHPPSGCFIPLLFRGRSRKSYLFRFPCVFVFRCKKKKKKNSDCCSQQQQLPRLRPPPRPLHRSSTRFFVCFLLVYL